MARKIMMLENDKKVAAEHEPEGVGKGRITADLRKPPAETPQQKPCFLRLKEQVAEKKRKVPEDELGETEDRAGRWLPWWLRGKRLSSM